MKYFCSVAVFLSIILIAIISLSCSPKFTSYCLTGAFLSDKPSQKDIIDFKNKYGKKPFLVMVFVDWDNFISEEVIEDVYLQDCVLFITWEPWYALNKEGVDYDELLSGREDAYIIDFANKLKDINKTVFLRFAHEMNGNWYSWSGVKIGSEKFVKIYRYVKDIFDKVGASNVKWVFSVNWEDMPKENNHFMLYYPGDEYADFIGIDGYNWGITQTWSKWTSFKDIFENRYQEIMSNLKKPVIISEFSSTSSGGDKRVWIKEAMNDIKKMKNIKAFVLFNVDKETDWSFAIEGDSGRELNKQLERDYFKDKN